MLDSLTGVLGAAEEDDVGAGRGAKSELIEGQALAASFLDPCACGRGEAQSADAQLRHLIEAVVIRDGTNDSADLALVRLGGMLVRRHGDDLGQRDGGPGDRWSIK